MGIKLFSDSEYKVVTNNVINIIRDPDPKKYTIKEIIEKNNYLCVLVNYPFSKSFEGNKILLYKDLKASELLYFIENKKEFDPHFLDNTNLTPILRIRPDIIGLNFLFDHFKINLSLL